MRDNLFVPKHAFTANNYSISEKKGGKTQTFDTCRFDGALSLVTKTLNKLKTREKLFQITMPTILIFYINRIRRTKLTRPPRPK